MKKFALVVCFGSGLVACSSSNNGTTGSTSAATGTTGAASSTSGQPTTSTTSGTTGVATATTGTTSGTTTSGSTTSGGGVCSTSITSNEFDQCATNADCGCPFICATDPVQGGLSCLFPCTGTASCPDTATYCVSGACITNVCAADGGTLYNACNAAGTNDGICQPSFDSSGNLIGECQQTGTDALAASCVQGAPRDAGAAALCVPGSDCEAQLDGGAGFLCTSVCDPTSTTSQCTATGTICAPNPQGDGPQDGVCVTTGDGGCANGFDPGTTLGTTCATSAGCGCPQNCVEDPVQEQLQCATPCTSTATDCSDPSTSCQSGFCVGNFCAPDSGPFYTACNAETDGGDGYCQPIINNNATTPDQVGVCYQTGTADSGFACDPNALRFDAGALCVEGTVCFAADGGNSFCAPGCDVNLTTCGAGEVCAVNYNVSSARAGICYPAGPGGCAEGLTIQGGSTELTNCTTNSYCGCPQTCIPDTGSASMLCELPCASASDCDQPTTACLSGSCAPNYCNSNPLGAAVPGAYDAPCTVSDAGDGTCQAQYPAFSIFGSLISEGLPAYGLCQLDGTDTVASMNACDESQTADAGLLCQSASQCFVIDQNGDTGCIGLCDPTTFDAGACGAGNGCFGFFSNFEGFPGIAPTYGICQACTTATATSGTTCLTSSECCPGLSCVMTSAGGACQ